MKVIFLDIDGVLNIISQGHDEFGSIFHSHLVDNLKYLIEQTGAKIVISSSWRLNGEKEMKAMWDKRKLPGEVIDITPYMGNNDFIGYTIPRGCEIAWYLNEFEEELNITNYVILDDDTDMLLKQKDNFVKCSENKDHPDCVDVGYGLTKICTEKAIEILNKQ